MDRVGDLSVEELGEIVEEIRSESEAEEADSIIVLLKYSHGEFLVYYTVDLPLSFGEFKRRVAESTGIRNIGRIRYLENDDYKVISSEKDWEYYINYVSFSSEPKLFVEEEEEKFEKFSVVKILDGGKLAISTKDTPIFIRDLELVKSLSKEKNKEICSNVLKLFNSLRRLRHPNVVQLYMPECAQNHDRMTVLMEYIPDTFQSLSEKFAFQENDIKSYLFSLLQAVRFLHRSNFILKDFSEKSLRVTEFGRVAISLFHLMEYEIDKKAFSPTYVSKETYDNSDHYSDQTNVFQIGCVVYSMLKGTTFEIPKSYYAEEAGKDLILEMISNDKSIDGEFLKFLQCCLCKEEHKRSTIEELITHDLLESEREKTILEYRVNPRESEVFELSSDSEEDDDENEGEGD